MTIHKRITLLMTICHSLLVFMTDDEVPPKRSQQLPATETNIKTTMSLIFEPSFEILKKQIGTDANPSETNFGDVQQHALILSEFSARLHDWPKIKKFINESEKQHFLKMEKELQIPELQQDAAKIYTAAKNKNFDSAQKSFAAMTHKCNICHVKMKSAWVPVNLKP